LNLDAELEKLALERDEEIDDKLSSNGADDDD